MTVLFAGQQIPKSPFEVNVDKALGDASKVTVKGPGIEPVGNIANKPTYFEICTAGQRNTEQTSEVVQAPKCSPRLTSFTEFISYSRFLM